MWAEKFQKWSIAAGSSHWQQPGAREWGFASPVRNGQITVGAEVRV